MYCISATCKKFESCIEKEDFSFLCRPLDSHLVFGVLFVGFLPVFNVDYLSGFKSTDFGVVSPKGVSFTFLKFGRNWRVLGQLLKLFLIQWWILN
ncbi:hypothetical protein FF1_045193 [Malus domestica]